MEIILARHGNTFQTGDKVTWVGANEDLPLVEKGREQALILARHLKQIYKVPDSIVTGSLKRSKEFGEIIGTELGVNSFSTDARLNELDYGDWGGKTNEEIAKLYSEQVLSDWNDKAVWPKKVHGNWQGSEAEILRELSNFLLDITSLVSRKRTLVVTSNGKIRFFLRLMPESFQELLNERRLKVQTGNYCLIDFHLEKLSLRGWNISPCQK